MRKASASPPGSSSEKVEPEPLHWASKIACCSGEASGPPAVRDGADARVGAQPLGQDQGVVLRPLHADVQGLQTAQQQPGGVRVGGGAADGPHLADARHEARPAHAAARDQVRVAADVFGQGIEDEVGAEFQRALPQGTQEGVVDGDDRRFGLTQRPGGVDCAGDVDQLVGRIGGVSR